MTVATRITALCALLLAVSPARAAELSELAAAAKPGVVQLAIMDAAGEARGNGTGFFVSEDGLIVTNHHVVKPAHSLRATLADGGSRMVVGMLAFDEERDIAVIKVEGEDYPALPLGEDDEIKEGVEVLVLGSPLGLSWTLSEGIVAAIREQGVPKELTGTTDKKGPLIQITAPISPGSSGSPVLTTDGNVIGVAVMASVQSAQNVNFAVPVSVVRQLLAGIPEGATPTPLGGGFPWINIVISVVVVAAIVAALVLTGTRRRRPGRKRTQH